MKRLRAVSVILGLAVMFCASCLATSAFAGSITVTDVGKSYGYATPDINNAITACQNSADKTLYFSGGTYVDTGNITFPSTINVQMGEGALLQVSSGVTVTFNGPFTAGLYRVFSDSGTVHFGNGAVSEVYPQWWGAATAADASPAINKAISSSPLLPGVKVRLSGTFNCQTTIHANRDRVNLIGDGLYATQLVFNPATPLPLVEFAKPDKSMVVQCAIRDLSLFGAGGWNDPARVQKIGIKIVDADIIEVRDIAMLNWTGNHSIGLQLQGRDFGFVENISVVADLPISIEKNPNLDWISIDHFTFRNNYLITNDPNGPAVKMASGIYLTNVVFEGTNSWCCGKYGLYWDDTETKGVSSNLSVKNVRMEQGAAAGGEIIHISHNYCLYNLVLENIYGCSGGVGGIYLRKCVSATLQNIFFTSVDKPIPTALDIDESSSNIVLINSFWNAGLVKTGKLIKTFGTNSNPAMSNNRLIEVYDRPNNPQGQGLILYGTNTWCYSGELANGAALPLPVGSGSKVATIIVSVTDGSAINESGYFMVGARGGTVKKVAGTDSTVATLTAGRLCLIPGNQLQLVNNLGAKVDVVITAFWR